MRGLAVAGMPGRHVSSCPPGSVPAAWHAVQGEPPHTCTVAGVTAGVAESVTHALPHFIGWLRYVHSTPRATYGAGCPLRVP
jgi:hypothetical protein